MIFEKLPLIVGVVGHRDIDLKTANEIRKNFENLMKQYRARFEDTPILVLTSLAAGADQLAAQSALEVEGVHLGTLVPFEVKEYRNTFERIEDLNNFDFLVSKSIFTYDTSIARGDTCDELDQKFRNNTRFLANHSDLLVAFWDGRATNLVGGTADTVYYKLRKQHRPNSLEDVAVNQREFGSVTVIPVDRSNFDDAQADYSMYNLEEVSIKKLPVNIEVNQLALNKNSWNKLSPDQYTNLNSQRTTHCDLLKIKAGAALENLKSKFKRSLLVILGSGFFFVASIELQAQTASKQIAAASLILVILSLLIIQIFRKRKVKEKYQQFLAIADASKIQDFWNRTNVKFEVSDYFLVGTNHENDWMRSLIRTASFLDKAFNLSADRYQKKQNSFISKWLNSEIDLLTGKNGSISKNLKNLKIIKGFTLISVSISAIIWFAVTLSLILDPENSLTYRGILQASFVLSLSLAATLSSYSYLLAFREQIFRETRALAILENAVETSKIKIQNLDKEIQDEKICESLGLYFLRDISEWYVRYSDREARTLL